MASEMASGLCAVCRTSAKLKCSRCKSVYYCGKDHQKADWENHRVGACLAYKIRSLPDYGRYVVANRDIKKGEKILIEAPLVWGPILNSCPGCLKDLHNLSPFANNTEDACPRCLWQVCSKKCPGLTDPKFHGEECKLLEAIKSRFIISNAEALFPLRCLLLQKTDPIKWKLVEDIARQSDSMRVEDKSRFEGKIFLEECVLKSLTALAPHLLPPDCSPKTLQRVSCVMQANGVLLRRPPSIQMIGLCEIASLMEHSCLPNTQLILETPTNMETGKITGVWVVVRARKDISKGEDLTTMVTDVKNSTMYRQEMLLNFRNKQCYCERCVDPTELGTHWGTLRCQDCLGWVLPVNPQDIFLTDRKCQDCGKILSAEYCRELERSLKYAIHNVGEEGRLVKTLDAMAAVKTRLNKLVHPHHHHMYVMNHFILHLYADEYSKVANITKTNHQEAADFCLDVLRLSLHPCVLEVMNDMVAKCLLALSKINFEITKQKIASKELNQARAKIIKKYCAELIDLAVSFNNGTYSDSDVEALRGNDIRLAPF